MKKSDFEQFDADDAKKMFEQKIQFLASGVF